MPKYFSKTTFLLIIGLLFYLASCQRKIAPCHSNFVPDETSKYFDENSSPFYHGVASGDPTNNEVTIWTRLKPKYNKEVAVGWLITLDSLQKNIVQQGELKTSVKKDFTVKHTISGLQADTYYWYSFSFNGKKSVTGRTKTLPVQQDSIRLIAVSCNAYEAGYFNAYEVIGKMQEKVDAVIHLGDYIYEGFLPQYFEVSERIPLPKKECVQLQDYRTRYAHYRLDKQLQLAHQMHPFIHIWDDHEIANDAYKDGAQAHDPEKEGSYEQRKTAARQAFYEWLPIKDRSRHFRHFNLGGMVELFLLDGRLEGRTAQQPPTAPTFQNRQRHLLGQSQFDWLVKGLNNSTATWKVIGNPVLFAKFNFSPVMADLSQRKADNWSGYPYERKKLLQAITSNQIDNLLFISGDSHCSWAFEIQHPTSDDKPLATELGVPSVTSGNWDSRFSNELIVKLESALFKHPENQHLKYVDLGAHGFLETIFHKNEVTGKWHFIEKNKLLEKDHIGKTCTIKKNKILFNKKQIRNR